MKLINLDHCVIEDNTSLKKESLFAFLEKNKNYDIDEIAKTLETSIANVKHWIYEFTLHGGAKKSNKEKALSLKKNDPSLSQRQIAKMIGVSHVAVNKYFQ